MNLTNEQQMAIVRTLGKGALRQLEKMADEGTETHSIMVDQVLVACTDYQMRRACPVLDIVCRECDLTPDEPMQQAGETLAEAFAAEFVAQKLGLPAKTDDIAWQVGVLQALADYGELRVPEGEEEQQQELVRVIQARTPREFAHIVHELRGTEDPNGEPE
jgi:hypothetical protein